MNTAAGLWVGGTAAILEPIIDTPPAGDGVKKPYIYTLGFQPPLKQWVLI